MFYKVVDMNADVEATGRCCCGKRAKPRERGEEYNDSAKGQKIINLSVVRQKLRIKHLQGPLVLALMRRGGWESGKKLTLRRQEEAGPEPGVEFLSRVRGRSCWSGHVICCCMCVH